MLKEVFLCVVGREVLQQVTELVKVHGGKMREETGTITELYHPLAWISKCPV